VRHRLFRVPERCDRTASVSTGPHRKAPVSIGPGHGGCVGRR
jgi:hypothetical protein